MYNQKGQIIFLPRFGNSCDYAEGLTAVKIKGKYGYINRKGEMVIKPRFDDADDFEYGFASVDKKANHFI